jgi:hypothetical protein
VCFFYSDLNLFAARALTLECWTQTDPPSLTADFQHQSVRGNYGNGSSVVSSGPVAQLSDASESIVSPNNILSNSPISNIQPALPNISTSPNLSSPAVDSLASSHVSPASSAFSTSAPASPLPLDSLASSSSSSPAGPLMSSAAAAASVSHHHVGSSARSEQSTTIEPSVVLPYNPRSPPNPSRAESVGQEFRSHNSDSDEDEDESDEDESESAGVDEETNSDIGQTTQYAPSSPDLHRTVFSDHNSSHFGGYRDQPATAQPIPIKNEKDQKLIAQLMDSVPELLARLSADSSSPSRGTPHSLLIQLKS